MIAALASASPLTGAQAAGEAQRLREAAQAFEAIFLRQLLKSARAADFGGEALLGGPGLEQFQTMQDEHFADLAARQGAFGLAQAIERQLAIRGQP